MAMTGQQMTIGATRAKRGEDVLAEICQQYRIDRGTLLGPVRTDDLVDARIAAAQRLRSAGFCLKRIADILNRDDSVIRYYFSSTRRKNRRDRDRLTRNIRLMPDNVRAVIEEMALDERTTPCRLIAEWISERVAYEIDAKNRAARAA